jgi:hypothetical protein
LPLDLLCCQVRGTRYLVYQLCVYFVSGMRLSSSHVRPFCFLIPATPASALLLDTVSAFEATFCPPPGAAPPPPPPPAGAADRNPARNRLGPKPTWPPAPSGETWPRTARTPGPTPRSTKIRDLVFEALTEVTAGGSSVPISWWDGDNRQAAPGSKAPRGR